MNNIDKNLIASVGLPVPKVKLPAEVLVSKGEIQQIRLRAQRELELIQQIRAEAERYRREIETKALSQAQMLIIHARLETQKEIAELKRKTNEEAQKMLTDIRMVLIAAQGELEAQKKFTSAARIRALSLEVEEGARQRVINKPAVTDDIVALPQYHVYWHSASSGPSLGIGGTMWPDWHLIELMAHQITDSPERILFCKWLVYPFVKCVYGTNPGRTHIRLETDILPSRQALCP